MEVNVEKKTKKVKVPFDIDKYETALVKPKVVCKNSECIIKKLAYFERVQHCIVVQFNGESILHHYHIDGTHVNYPHLDLMFEIEEETEPEITIKCSKEELAFIGKCFGNLVESDYKSDYKVLGIEKDKRHIAGQFKLIETACKSLNINLYDSPIVNLEILNER